MTLLSTQELAGGRSRQPTGLTQGSLRPRRELRHATDLLPHHRAARDAVDENPTEYDSADESLEPIGGEQLERFRLYLLRP